MRFQNTPEKIEELLPNEVIVVGTNIQGIHGAGLALLAKQKWGLVQGVSTGLSGQSYGIITKDLRTFNPEGPKHESYKKHILLMIASQILQFYMFAFFNPEKTFYMTLIGCGLGGFTVEELKDFFIQFQEFKPGNVVLPKEFDI